MISAVVVTYNRKLLLKECLDSLFNQNFSKEYEIIIIDNCSCDGTEELIKKEYGGRISFVKNAIRLSLAACKNLGVKESLGDTVAFIDDDCLATNNWLNIIEKSLDNYDFVGGAVLPMPGTIFPWWWKRSLDWLVGINLNPNVKFLPLGSNIAFKKYVLDVLQKDTKHIANYNDQYLPYAEDNFRVKKALSLGFSMKINPNMIVYHYVPKKRLKLAYLMERSYNEGYAWVTWERNIKIFIFSFVALMTNSVRLAIFLDINRLFRMIVNISYVLHYLTINREK